ncbi:isoprenylcysteine carboxylmethyltransferase family protein [Streptomyces bathyalis]|uniref:Isoprenylcysteine carboxylmethyltransferase family protein n=1 Tax=Streptomyces bathyalis TaxID=2710756 RepID=A0A7T1WQL0_9ACTN|nr:isoprenylcysteine carboxylmethyltransferase family protein [Streptomyces bathyalis]QPP05306.1 isoprenylcysteine carboxylmethyltransferase family protein [Streptomyces bathyalis]
MRILRHAIAILVAPVTVTVLVPILLSVTTGLGAPDSGAAVTAVLGTLGAVFMAIGLTLVVWTIALFDRVGDGTLAPWDAPRKLVVRGPYLHVRNPMISGVLFILLGEALLFRSPVLLGWFVAFFAVNQTYIPLWEERGLERRFGQDYVTYKHHVRRWLPRFHPWHA